MNTVFKTLGREELKETFLNGKLPSEKDFAQLIDSGINILDDGFGKDEKYGFVMASTNKIKKFISFFRTTDEPDPFMIIERSTEGSEALHFAPSSTDANNNSKGFFFHTNGSLGIGKVADEKYTLDMASGFAGLHSRSGTYATGSVRADGKWHPIITNLDNCQAFEIVARTGIKHTGKFSIMHAIALSAFGGRARNKIRKTTACYGFFWNKINIKWSGSLRNYALSIRTNSNYGSGIYIYYNVTRLWDDSTFLPEGYYY